MEQDVVQCRNCGATGAGKYCSRCGQELIIKKITVASVLRDVLHLFTHLDKGFGYTLKQLIAVPGTMQRRYVEGERRKHQKPFSMFFICATIAGLTRYWIYSTLIKYYHVGDVAEAEFFHQYMVILHVCLLPVYILITYILFRKDGYNYAETGVMILYAMSFFFLLVTVISFLKFIWPEMDTAYIELPVVAVYMIFTTRRFFIKERPAYLYVKALISVLFTFLVAHYTESLFLRYWF